MKPFLLVSVCGVLALLAPGRVSGLTAGTTAGPGWSEKAPEFKPGATEPGEPIVLFFTAGWCGFCKQLEREALADPLVREKLAPLARHRLDFDQHRGLAREYGLRGVPVLLLVDASGRELSRLTGLVSRETVLGWLGEATTQTGAMKRAEEKLAAELRGLPQLLQSPRPAERTAALERLWQLAARGTPAAQTYARAELPKLIQADPAIFALGLGARDLAVRLVAANLLRQVTEGRSQFDPWAGEAARSAALDQLREAWQR